MKISEKKYMLLHISQLFGIGKINVAPGTVASLATCLISYPFIFLSIWWKISVLIILTVTGIIASSYAETVLKVKDPSSVVIDEMVGQLVVFCFISKPNFFSICLGFVLFRLFDILKPPPIRNVEKMFSSGMGIMADDIVAGLIGGIFLFGILKFSG